MKPKPRPLSPHLSIYKPIPTMMMSILHRITGGALYFGTILVALWLMAAAGRENYFNMVNGFFGSIFGRLILFFYTWALMQHMLGGLRHLMWDLGFGFEIHYATRMAKLSVVASILLTLAIWAIGYWAQ